MKKSLMEIEDPEEKRSSIGIINSESDTVRLLFASTILWTLSYFILRRLFSTKSAEYSCRFLTMIHGLTASIVGMSQCFLNENPFEHPDWITNDIQNLLMIFSLGYFIFDVTWFSYYRTETALMTIHHIYTIYILKSMLDKGYSGAQACCSIGCMEITNPLLQLRWFVRTEGYHKTFIFYFVEVLFFVLFFIFRLIIGSYILSVVFLEKNDLDIKIATAALYFISIVFITQMVKYAVSKYATRTNLTKPQVGITTQHGT